MGSAKGYSSPTYTANSCHKNGRVKEPKGTVGPFSSGFTSPFLVPTAPPPGSRWHYHSLMAPTNLVNMDVEEMLLVVHGLDEAFQLADGSPMNYKHVGNSDWVAHGGLEHSAVIPLDHGADFP